jgi:hypothetical protein
MKARHYILVIFETVWAAAARRLWNVSTIPPNSRKSKFVSHMRVEFLPCEVGQESPAITQRSVTQDVTVESSSKGTTVRVSVQN